MFGGSFLYEESYELRASFILFVLPNNIAVDNDNYDKEILTLQRDMVNKELKLSATTHYKSIWSS